MRRQQAQVTNYIKLVCFLTEESYDRTRAEGEPAVLDCSRFAIALLAVIGTRLAIRSARNSGFEERSEAGPATRCHHCQEENL